MDDSSVAKKALRTAVLNGRAIMDAEAAATAAEAITATLLALPVLRAARTVAAYVSLGSEVSTQSLLAALTDRGVTVLLPVLAADGSLTWRELSRLDALVPGRHGLREPPPTAPARDLGDAAVVIVPGVAFDRAGNRLGRGGGSYDRALNALPPGVTTIAAAFDSDIVESVPVDPHDKRVAMIVTPTRVIVPDEGGT